MVKKCLFQHCEGPDVPFSLVRSLSNNSVLHVLDTNSRLRELSSKTALPQHQFHQIALPSQDYPHQGASKAHLHILLPPGYMSEDRIAFPTILKM